MKIEAIVSLGFLLSGLAVPLTARTDVVTVDADAAFGPRRLDLSLAPNGRSLLLAGGHPFARFIVVAGLDRSSYDLPNGLQVGLQPLLQVGHGFTDALGQASIPIALESDKFAGDMILLQAAGWLTNDESMLPRMLSPVLAASMVPSAHDSTGAVGDVDTAPGDVDDKAPGDVDDKAPGAHLAVIDESKGFATRVELISTDSIPPQWTVSIRMTAPTGGHKLAIESIAIGGQNVYVAAVIETPAPGEVTTDALEELAVSADLGPAVAFVEVRIRERQRPSDQDIPAKAPISDQPGG